ncbi:MAG: hypothetical protein ABJE95_28485 [Byssovorax sp.]
MSQSNQTRQRRVTLGALALVWAAILHAVSASGCQPETAIIHDCVVLGPDAGDAGLGGATALPPCN